MTTAPDISRAASTLEELADYALGHLIEGPDRHAITELATRSSALGGLLPTLDLVLRVARQHGANERVVCLAFGYAPRIRRDYRTGVIRRLGWVDLTYEQRLSDALLDLTHDAELGAYLVHRWLTDGMGSPAVRVNVFEKRPREGNPE